MPDAQLLDESWRQLDWDPDEVLMDISVDDEPEDGYLFCM